MRLALAATLLLAAAPALAQNPAHDPTCSNVRVALPPELSGWSEQAPVAAGITAGGGASVVPGQAVLVSLHPANLLTLRPAPQAVTANGGTLTLTIDAPGTYRVALGGKAWVDLVRDGKALSAAAHGHGPKCTGVRKMVDFALTAGSYTIQLSGSEASSLALMVARLG
ncbi:hypothetical protein [Sphingomonas jeddahensis]|uniref:Homogentisate 1,2-dioxygenase n=1 Tax=Sphingomonas jeddahensis TaxID=1915074 RepID=A0A1V2EW66_9SPHN|nr:hypothetical protein [Sphingomonas jeddahensis]ONF96394.1 hypothetical protein SPHI_16260 [Sphingomonas jeddahensis]